MEVADSVRHLLIELPNQLCKDGAKVFGPAAHDALHMADRMAKEIRLASANAAKFTLNKSKLFQYSSTSNTSQTSIMTYYANSAKKGLKRVGNGTLNLGKRLCFWRKGVE